MKVFAILCLVVAVVGARSGPYLPSGWKPSGPAFLLPGEVQKPSDNPLKETLQVEAEGSDFLREYGPPSQDITKQNLPEVIIERSFAEIKTNEIAESVETAAEAKEEVVEEVKEIVQAVTEIKEDLTEELAATTVAVEVATEKLVLETESEIQEDVKVEAVTEQLETVTVAEEESAKITEELELKENENANSDLIAVQEVEKTVTEEREGKSVDAAVEVEKEIEGVKNIEEALVNLENEIKSQQVKTIEIVETTVQQNDATPEQAPEGFLEYGPPGFTEYGPPKELLRTGINEEVSVESNETRRRRFSPKIRLSRRAQH